MSKKMLSGFREDLDEETKSFFSAVKMRMKKIRWFNLLGTACLRKLAEF